MPSSARIAQPEQWLVPLIIETAWLLSSVGESLVPGPCMDERDHRGPERPFGQVLSEAEESLARIRERRGWQEREELLEAIEQTGGNVSRAAEILRKSRTSIYHLLSKHGISLVRRG